MAKAYAIYQVTYTATNQETKGNPGAQVIKGKTPVAKEKNNEHYRGRDGQGKGVIGEKSKDATGVGDMC